MLADPIRKLHPIDDAYTNKASLNESTSPLNVVTKDRQTLPVATDTTIPAHKELAVATLDPPVLDVVTNEKIVLLGAITPVTIIFLHPLNYTRWNR